MAVYNNKNANGALSTVEFTPVSEGNFAFFYIDEAIHRDPFKQWLATQGQRIVGESEVSGKTVLVTRGEKPKEAILKALEERGEKMEFHHHQSGMDVWTVIATLGPIGQVLQVASSTMRNKLDWGLATFAGANLIAHGIAFAYGSQKSDDPNRLHFIKEKVSKDLEQHIPASELPGLDDHRASLHNDPHRRTLGESTNNFLKRYSVRIGELGLRYLGVFALAFPTDRWKAGANALAKGSLKEAFQAARNPSKLVFMAGAGSILGKTVALFSKVPDPYDPKPHGIIDHLREQYAFRAGGWIETLAFGTMAYDAFSDTNRKLVLNGKEYKDYLGGIGASLFTLRYMVRHWAKFGEKNVDMEELYAHVTDGLSKVSGDKLPQVIADVSAEIAEHFHDKKLDYGTVYTQLMTDLYRYHHIALDNLETKTPERAEKFKKKAEKNGFASEHKPHATYTDAVSVSKEPTLGAGLQ